MASLTECVHFLDNLLDIHSIPFDNSNNGLQVQGAAEINKVAFAVDASLETFRKSVEQGAQLLVVHHGISWDASLRRIVGLDKERLKFLLEHDLSLYAAHLPLDKHGLYGNNAQLFKLLELQEPQRFGSSLQFPIGFQGVFSSPQTTSSIVSLLTSSLGEPLHIWEFGVEKNSSVALCTGSGGTELPVAIAQNVDLFVTGELHHKDKIFTQEGKINVIAAGHYATETLGVKALMSPVQEEKKLDTVFIDAPTGL